MKQVVQATSGGPVQVLDVPRPTIGAADVLVRTLASVVSPGTERAVTTLARSNLLAKARARPDLVRQVVRKAQRDGVRATARAVRTRLDDYTPLGYSAAGIAVEVGEAVSGVTPGQLVATGGAGRANHAEYQSVPGLLCVPVPEGVSAADAAFATVGSIALHGLRLADVAPGARIVVAGLGLIGQLALHIARASGCEVAGLDVAGAPVERAHSAGVAAFVDEGGETTKAVLEWTRGRGADAVIVAAATPSSALMRRVPELCRDGGRVVVVGDVGLDIERRPFYERELSLHFARSYGPGRYERSYEEWAVDYPAGAVRWTEGRNIEAVLDLLASGRLVVADLVTHRYPIEDAAAAYVALTGEEDVVGAVITYPGHERADAPIRVQSAKPTSGPRVGLIGAGAFASTVLLPALREAGFDRFTAVASASGLGARRVAERAGFERAVSGAEAVIDDGEVDAVVITTPHDTHAAFVARALQSGKHVFCEKPLALTFDELDAVEEAFQAAPGAVLFVGFNRRWSGAVGTVREHFGATGGGPLVVTYRVNAGELPAAHWYHDRRQGGRLLGEVCHFVDTCAALVGANATSVHAVGSGSRSQERLLADDLAVVLGYRDGSVATITYATGGPAGVEKERIEVLGRGRSAVIVDFKQVLLDQRDVGRGQLLPGKGHVEECRAFLAAIRTGDRTAAHHALASTRTTLEAAAALTSS